MTNATVSGGQRLLWIAIAALCFALIPTKAGAENYWFERYERAVSLIDAGSFDEAAVILDKLIQEHPEPIASLRVPGDRYVDYDPYLQRARVLIQKGDTRGASHNLDICEAFGAMKQSRKMEEEFKSLRGQIVQAEASRSGRPKPAVAAVGSVKN